MKTRFAVFVNHIINCAVIFLFKYFNVQRIFIDKCLFSNLRNKIGTIAAEYNYIVDIRTVANVFGLF